MRIKILLLGDYPPALVPDRQLLRDKGMLVFTSFNLENIDALIDEIKPDLIFFDAQNHSSNQMNDTYNAFINNMHYAHLPVIFTLEEDDIYLVTRKRTDIKSKRKIIANNIISALKLAFSVNKVNDKKTYKIHYPSIALPTYNNRA